MSNRRFTAVEFFAGGGGLAVGLREAGFDTMAAVEVEPHAAATFKANHTTVQVFRQDVRTVTGDMIAAVAGGRVDALAACPPCQGFSSLTSKWRKEDERNALVSEVGRLADQLMPRAIMLENVPGLARKGKPLFDTLLEQLEGLGYETNWSVLQVADYGVPQRRRRLVMLAGLGFSIPMPEPTHSQTGEQGRPKWRTVRDAIKDMDDPVTLSEAKQRGGPQAFDWHVVRQLSPANVERLKLSRPGGNWKDIPEELRVPCHRGGYKGFPNVYGRMVWDEPSGTITAGCTTPSKGRFGHPERDRTISLREAALLQTFPKDYRFETPYFERACEIVGNALPCVFAEAVARVVWKEIEKREVTCC